MVKSNYLKTHPSRKLLILDLDGTLINSSFGIKPDHYCLAQENDETTIYFQKRPGVDQFLQWCAQRFDLAVWSAGSFSYVYTIVSQILHLIPFKFMFSLDECREYADISYAIKPLDKVLQNYPYRLENIHIVDGHDCAWSQYSSHVTKIKEWKGETDDVELQNIKAILDKSSSPIPTKLSPCVVAQDFFCNLIFPYEVKAQ